MDRGMSPVRFVRTPSLLRPLAVASIAVAAAVLPGAAGTGASAEGATRVVARRVQGWREAPAGAPEADGPISGVQNADGDAVRIPTEDVDGIPAGTTLEVTVGPQDDAAAADPL